MTYEDIQNLAKEKKHDALVKAINAYFRECKKKKIKPVKSEFAFRLKISPQHFSTVLKDLEDDRGATWIIS